MPCFALQEMELEDAHVWFVRFAMDRQCRTLACGTRSGHVFVWDPADLKSKPHAKLKRDPGSKTTVSAPILTAAARTALYQADLGHFWYASCMSAQGPGMSGVE